MLNVQSVAVNLESSLVQNDEGNTEIVVEFVCRLY